MDRWTRLGIEAYRTGNREQAQRFFHYALMERPNDIRTWLWLVEVADNDAEKQRCLTRVLALDPNHVLAMRALEEIEARLANKNVAFVGPFEQEADPGGGPSHQEAAVEIRSAPPFIEELAQQYNKTAAAPLQAHAPHATVGRKRTWTVIGLAVGGLVVLSLLLAWILHLI